MKLVPLKCRLVGTDVAHHTPESVTECECQMCYLKSNAMTFRILSVAYILLGAVYILQLKPPLPPQF